MKTTATVFGILAALCLAPLATAGDAPSDVYAVYMTAQQAGDLDGMAACVIEAKAQELKAMPDSQKAQIAELMKMGAPSEYTVVNEDIRGDKAILSLEGKGTDFSGNAVTMTGTATFAREDGAWKLKRDSWKSSAQ